MKQRPEGEIIAIMPVISKELRRFEHPDEQEAYLLGFFNAAAIILARKHYQFQILVRHN